MALVPPTDEDLTNGRTADTSKGVAEIISNATAQSTGGDSAPANEARSPNGTPLSAADRINADLDRLMALYAAEREKMGAITSAEHCKHRVRWLWGQLNKIAPETQTTAAPGGLHLIDNGVTVGQDLNQVFEDLLRAMIGHVRAGGANIESLEYFAEPEPPPKAEPPSSAPYEDESHLDDEDAYEHDGLPLEQNKDRVKDKFVLLDVVATDQRLRGLPASIMVHMICRYANRHSGQAYPGNYTLADSLEVTRRGIQKAIDLLTRLGYLALTRRGGGERANVYRPEFPPGIVRLDEWPWYERRAAKMVRKR
jgi:hypothetical protein